MGGEARVGWGWGDGGKGLGGFPSSKIKQFQCFKVSKFQISKFQISSLTFLKFQRFKIVEIQKSFNVHLENIDPILPKIHFVFLEDRY